MRIACISPVYNDVQNIRRNIEYALSEFKRLNYDVKLIVVDDGSTDGTLYELLNMSKSNFSRVGYLPNKGKGCAFMRGLEEIEDCTHVMLMDSDLQIPIRELRTLVNVMSIYSADAVIGNKRHAYSQIEYTLTRRIVSNGYNFMIRKLFGIELRDTQAGFKLFKREAILAVKDKIKVKRFAFDIEVIVALRENNFRVADAPIHMIRQYNKGSVSFKNIIETGVDTLKVWWRKKQGYYGKREK
jgi:glycosyltransferase involved in cell wall biosynthesis